LHHFADQFGAVGKQARDVVVDVIEGEHEAADPEFVHRSVLGPSSDRFRRVELVQLDPSVAVRCAHQREGGTDVLKANETIYGGALDGRLALQLESEFEKEGLRGFKVVDDDEDVVQSLDCHVTSIAEAVRGAQGDSYRCKNKISWRNVLKKGTGGQFTAR